MKSMFIRLFDGATLLGGNAQMRAFRGMLVLRLAGLRSMRGRALSCGSLLRGRDKNYSLMAFACTHKLQALDAWKKGSPNDSEWLPNSS